MKSVVLINVHQPDGRVALLALCSTHLGKHADDGTIATKDAAQNSQFECDECKQEEVG